ncbi:hypothetical protein TNCV_2569731 [Trichonephila clavipes]|nr:hypothetical protein TNCV_2569731 [Trichonephila clavipes]
MQVKNIEALSPAIAMVWKFEEEMPALESVSSLASESNGNIKITWGFIQSHIEQTSGVIFWGCRERDEAPLLPRSWNRAQLAHALRCPVFFHYADCTPVAISRYKSTPC